MAEGEAGREIDQNGELREKISPCAFVPVSTCRGTCFRAEIICYLYLCIVFSCYDVNRMCHNHILKRIYGIMRQMEMLPLRDGTLFVEQGKI